MNNNRRISESELVIPALVIMAGEKNGEITTSMLIEKLTNIFDPSGEDLEILNGRSDTKFSQKVRNLKSHKTIKEKGCAKEIDQGFRITDYGKEYIRNLFNEKV